MKVFLCPMCLHMQTHFIDIYQELRGYGISIEDGYLEEDEGECLSSEHVLSRCPICGENQKSYAQDFLIEIKNNKIISIGEYWKKNKDILQKNKERILKDAKEIVLEKVRKFF